MEAPVKADGVAASAPVAPVAPPEPVAQPEPERVAVVTDVPKPTPTVKADAPPAADPLQAEVGMLRRARELLNAGKPAAAAR